MKQFKKKLNHRKINLKQSKANFFEVNKQIEEGEIELNQIKKKHSTTKIERETQKTTKI
jgi:hypothetical protein